MPKAPKAQRQADDDRVAETIRGMRMAIPVSAFRGPAASLDGAAAEDAIGLITPIDPR